MTSCTATAPIDIPTGSNNVNSIKGKFNLVYAPDMCASSSLTISNDRTYLSLSCSSSGSAISFYGTPYVPSEIRIYSPSLHTYNGANADAEILIVHMPGSGSTSTDGLIVSIPVSLSGSASGNMDLAAIIQASGTIDVTTISINPSVPMNYDVNANNFIPSNPYYVYYGTLPYDSCSGNYYYAVFKDVVSTTGPISALVASNIVPVQPSIRTNLQKSNTGPITGADSGSIDDYVLFQVMQDYDDEDDAGSGANGANAGSGADKPSVQSSNSSIGMNIVWGILIALTLLGISYMFLTNNDGAQPSAGGVASSNPSTIVASTN